MAYCEGMSKNKTMLMPVEFLRPGDVVWHNDAFCEVLSAARTPRRKSTELTLQSTAYRLPIGLTVQPGDFPVAWLRPDAERPDEFVQWALTTYQAARSAWENCPGGISLPGQWGVRAREMLSASFAILGGSAPCPIAVSEGSDD